MSREQTWQPIETAPRDGTKILIFAPIYGGLITVARWDLDKYASKPRPRWDSSDYLYRRSEEKVHPPTHWQPLPDPPVQQ